MVGWGVEMATRCGEKEMVKYLARGIDNLGCKVLVLISNHLAECVLDGGIVAVDKVAIDKLYRQTRLACTAGQYGTFSHATYFVWNATG
jgi:hypothetical protein